MTVNCMTVGCDPVGDSVKFRMVSETNTGTLVAGACTALRNATARPDGRICVSNQLLRTLWPLEKSVFSSRSA